MCVVSMVGDFYRDQFKQAPWEKYIYQPICQPEVTKADFDKLREKVDEMVDLLKRAQAYDIATGQAGCEMEEKLALLRQIAALVGVDLDEVLAKKVAGAVKLAA